MKKLLIKIYRYLTDRHISCGVKYEYGSFGYGCSFKYCPECDIAKDRV